MNKEERGSQQKLVIQNSETENSAQAGLALQQEALQRGISSHQAGRFDEAVHWYKKTLEFNPENVSLLSNMGVALQSQGKLAAAAECYQKAISINPNYAEAHSNLGLLFQEQGQLDAAVVSYQKAIAIKPDFAMAYSNLGYALTEQGKFAEAVVNLHTAISLQPNYADAHYNLGIALAGQSKLEEAIVSYQNTISIQPDYVQAYNNIGNALKELVQLDDAVSWYKKAISIQPGFKKAHSNLLFAINYHPDLSAEEIYAEYKNWNERQILSQVSEITEHDNELRPEKRLRVGYVSSDFRSHACRFFVEPLLANHNQSEVELFAYANVAIPDAVTIRLKKLFHRWCDIVGMSDEAIIKQIRADGIDILVDLAGHTRGNFLTVFARKPAPIQVSWMGYGYTTGLTAMDYFLADPIFVPEGAGHLFSEKIFRLEKTYAVYRPSEEIVAVGPLPARSNGYVTFGYFSRSVRMNIKTIKTWAEILKRVAGSRLLLNEKKFLNPGLAKILLDQFLSFGVASDRIILKYQTPPWSSYNQIDIALDPFPHNAGTTTFDALYMGVPVITLVGRPPVGRFGATILGSLGAEEWVTENSEDYVACAVALSAELQQLEDIRANLRQRMEASPLRDEPDFAREVERAYRTMWRGYCSA